MAIFDAEKAYKKESWSGEEAGQAYIYAYVSQIGKGLFEIPGNVILERTRQLNAEQFKIYRQYMWVYDWLAYEFALAQATLFHAQSAVLELLDMLTNVDRAHKMRNSILRTPLIYDHNKRLEIESQNARLMLSWQRTFTPEDVLDLLILYSTGKIADRDTLNKFNEEFRKGKPIAEDLRSAPDVDKVELDSLEALKAAVIEEAEQIGRHVNRRLLKQLLLSLSARISSDKPKASGLISIKGYKELKHRAAQVSRLSQYSFKTLFYSDFAGFWGLLLAAGDPLKASIRFPTADGTISMTDRPPRDDEVNIAIHNDGSITDKTATPELMEQLSADGLMRFSPGDYRRGLYSQKYSDVIADVEATHKYNALIDAAAKRIGVKEMRLYKRSLEQIQETAHKYNLILSEICVNSAGHTPAPGLEPEPGIDRNLYIYLNRKEQAKSREIALCFLNPIEIELGREYPATVTRRIDEAFKDLSIFAGNSNKIYSLFSEGESD